MIHSPLAPDLDTWKYILTHVFCPLRLPDGSDHSVSNDHSLAIAVTSAAHLFSDHVNQGHLLHWERILRMLDRLQAIVRFRMLDEKKTLSQLSSMTAGDVLVFPIQAQNAAVVFRKQEDVTVFESFEVSPMAESVMTARGKLICSYPGPAIEVPNPVFDDKSFLPELINFLVHMNNDVLDAAPTTRKAQSTVLETRDTTHPRYITELLTGILRSVGHPADVIRISKRVGDDVVWNNSKLPWRRSSLWLLIRVVLQTSLNQSTLGHDTYKAFMLFFMCCLANEKGSADLSNDLLQFMSAKISRRLRKLGSSAPDWLSRMVLGTSTSLRSILERRWREVQAAQRVSPVWAPSQLDLNRDIQLSLLNSGDYIRNSLDNHTINLVDTPFHPEHHARGTLNVFLSSDGTFFEDAYRLEPYVALYDVERAVEEDLDGWVDDVIDNDKACEELELLASKYSSSARKAYETNPELLSVMLLTTIELWIALDRVAIKEIPMLADYSPEIPTSLLEDLLLSKASNLHRVRRAHQYLSHRHSECRWSVFSLTITANSLPVRFYRESSDLQALKGRIEEAAQRGVHEKVTELRQKNARHAELQRKATGADHLFAINRHGHEYHANYCDKCRLEQECRRMKIAVHEWPLPAEQLKAEAVVFELDCPVSFNMWRSATSHLLVDLCSPSVEPCSPYILLTGYAALQPYLAHHPRSRITLASDTKPIAVTHYGTLSIPATQERVCVKNGLEFYGYDSHACISASEVPDGVNIREYCTYILPCGPYKKLQKYVDTTSHSSNAVVANQADCHMAISISEYMAFGHLRSGGLLQWPNILRELRGRSLSFRHPEVHLLLAQAVSQVGPLVNLEWAWHWEVEQMSFCLALLEELESLVQDVEANWLEAVTMDTVSFLLRRLLVSSPNPAVSFKAIELLRTVRHKVFSWVRELAAKLMRTPGDEESRRFLRDTAVVCRSTFDVDSAVIPRLLHSAEDVEVLAYSAVLIHDHTPSKVSTLPKYSQLLLSRDRRLSLVLEDTLRDAVRAGPGDQGIDLAVKKLWPGYRPGSKWTPLQNPDSRWLSCTTAPTAAESSQVVHYNSLDGSLLVDKKPLGRLPSEILQHPVYNLIFGEQVLDIIPSDVPGMDYSTRAEVANHQVYFTLRDNDLVIQAKQMDSKDSKMMELIPQEKMMGDLPAVLVEGYAHWLNLSTSIMEIRPLDTLWQASSENWEIHYTPGEYRMQKGREFLVDIRSQSWNMVSALLKPFDILTNLIISISPIDPTRPSSSQVSVVLPRYSLSFYIDEDGDLQSYNMRGMVYDEDQSIGTLFGLVNRLVLRPKTRGSNPADLIHRCLLVPEGKISFRKDGHHVCVEIDTLDPPLQHVTYQTYRVDTDLGCLLGTVNLTNKLYCAYLHVLTSGCCADPFTGRSGTEEALSLLRSASCWSIIKFSPQDVELLTSIASICPSRTWYPRHLTRMQNVKWLDLPVNSQHHDLYIVSKAIKEHYEKVQLFYENQTELAFPNFPSLDSHLLERSASRAAYLFPSELPAGNTEPNVDVHYPARDVVEHNSGEHRAYSAATAIYHRSSSASTTKNILSMVESWGETILGSTLLSLRYEKLWLTPNLPCIWLTAYKLLRTRDEGKWFQLLFSLPAMAYASPEVGDLVPIFIAIASCPQFRLEDPSSYDSYTILDGYSPSSSILGGYVSSCAHSFNRCPESSEPERYNESHRDLQRRRLQLYNSRLESDTDTIVGYLLNAWPCETLPRVSLNRNLYDVAGFTSSAQHHFSSCYRNLKLKEHLIRVQDILDDVTSEDVSLPDHRYSFHPPKSDVPSHISWSLTVDHLFFCRPAPPLQVHDGLPLFTADVENIPPSGSPALHQLIDMAEADAVDPFRRRYASALRTSAECFASKSSTFQQEVKPPTAEDLVTHYLQCKDNYFEAFRYLEQHLSPRSLSELALWQSGQWPCITPYTLLRSLASNSSITLTKRWKGCLTTFALIVLELQRARRLLRLHCDNLDDELRRELRNGGCDGWNAEEHPDWLLIQLQGNFLVRRVQAEVAHEMISPRSGDNTAMQLNMGEGKSSVIVPIVVAVLADGHQLVRVIVPKALTVQMFDILADRLGGIANRRLYFIPFSRSVELDLPKVAALRELMSECMKEHGILVVQPEHVLSLKLLSVEKQLLQEKDAQQAQQLLELQRWLHSRSRDILDESDEILHVRYQLVYTIGTQQHIEGFPERWTTTEQVLGLVSKHASSLQELFPHGIEYERGPSGSFPHLRILDAGAGQELIARIVRDVIDGRLPNFNFGQLRSGLKDVIRSFISCSDVSPEEVQCVKDYSRRTPLWGGLLHLRGLLACGILLFAFRERRWRVDYGLAPARTMLAVPYRAKDVPAQRAEFGHPDIAVMLTCLSYYYGGLDEEQLRHSFETLLKQDDPSLDYSLWVEDCPDVPVSLQTLSGINIKSLEQWKKFLLPRFRRNRATIDFYLSNVVFPKEAKEFPSKLSCSGWDLAEKKERLLTGFSGTNDGRYLLPLHITQHDPDHQRGTNAKVISYLLQSENRHYMCMTRSDGERRTTREFLKILVEQNPAIRVLLDVGAQMLDLQNDELAEAWLDVNLDASAAIYFNKDDELTVRTRDGRTQPLVSSPFAQQLDRCVVYLDDVHTRGTDIKFPSGFRAAVTLGPKVTKDRLAQACMRMRKLGHGHSIMFFAPLEIDRRIRFLARKGPGDVIDTMNILHWAICETCDDIQHRAPHWAQQGMDHTARYAVWTSFCEGQLTPGELSDKWLQPEAKKLEALYGPHAKSSLALSASPDIRQRCIELGISRLRDVGMDEEQEREVIHEAERERQVERPPKVPPASHSVHRDVYDFIKTGVIPRKSEAFRPAFAMLDATSAITDEAHIWSPNLLVTMDFEKTVSSSGMVDEYLRPVRWIVSGKRYYNKALVILSPHEANQLMPYIRLSDKVHVHLYTPRITKSMRPCDDLDLYNVPTVPTGWTSPPSLMDQLNVFAGQLYLKDYKTYIRLCRFLCVYARDLQDEKNVEAGHDGFIAPNNRPKWRQSVYTFQKTPLDSLKTLTSLRRNGMRFSPTHMGYILDGRLLSEDDFGGHDNDSVKGH